jgi:transposase InsO family protein
MRRRRIVRRRRHFFHLARHLRELVREYVAHYHRERSHQGLDNQLIEPTELENAATGRVRRRKRLGGMLNFYYRAAA